MQNINPLSDNIDLNKLRGQTVLVTGATGSIGEHICAFFAELNKQDFALNVLAVGRNEEKGKKLSELNGIFFVNADLRYGLDVSEHVDYIIHCAAVTASAKMVAEPVSVIETEILGGRNVLELAKKNQVKGMVYTSSMEVYGLLDKESVFEDDMGYLDLTSVRSCYPQSKRMVETMCNCYAQQFNLPVSVARLGMTVSPDFSDTDNRIYAQFARCAQKCEDIVLRTDGTSVSAFAYIADAVNALIMLLLSDKRGTYNVAATHCSIRELANKVAQIYGLRVIINKPADISKFGYASEFKLPLNCDKIKAIGWSPAVDTVEKMYGKMCCFDLHSYNTV